VAVSPPSLRVSSVAFRPGSSTLALGTDAGVAFWRAPFAGREPRLVAESAPVAAVSFAPDGEELAVAGDGVVVLRCDDDRCDEAGRLARGTSAVDAAFAGDGAVAVVGSDGHAALWRGEGRGGPERELGSGALSVAAGTGGSLAVGTTSGSVLLGGESLRGQGDWVVDLAFSPRSDVVAAASYDGTVVLRRVDAAALRREVGGLDELEDATFASPTRLAAAGVVLGAGGVFSCDLRGCGAPAAAASDLVRLASDGRGHVAAADGGTLTLWPRGLGRPSVRARVRRGALGVAVGEDGGTLALGTGRGSVVLWRTAPRLARVRTLRGGGMQAIRAVALDPHGGRVAAGDQAGRVVLWTLGGDARPTVVRARGEAVRAVVFSPDGGLLAFAGADQRIALWDVGRRRPLAVLQRGGEVTSLAFAPDGRTLASAERTSGGVSLGRVVLWRVDEQPILGRPLGEPGAPVAALSFRPDGRVLAVARTDGSLAFWSDVGWNADRAVERICAVIARPLSEREWREISPEGARPGTC
jgi:WD40 repeat protein